MSSLLASLLVTPALAGSLGVEDPPEPPSSRHKTYRMSEIRSDLGDDIPMPEILVPMRYERTHRVLPGKYYDEDGNVYPGAQVFRILQECGDACEDHLDDYERARNKQMVWSSIGAIGTLLFLPAGLIADCVSLGYVAPANDAWGRTVKDYNTRAVAAPAPSRR